MDQLIKYLPLIAGLIAVFKWLFEYSKYIKWEKNKYLIEMFRYFSEKKSTSRVHTSFDPKEIVYNIN